jgi:hypothetical protein
MTRRSRSAARPVGDPDDIRDQEVARANKELAAYFKGQRTEREARAALKTIKAYVRDRERVDAASRRPLPGRQPKEPTGAKPRKLKLKKQTRPKKAARRTRGPVRLEPSMEVPERSDTPSPFAVDSTDN